MKIFSEPFYYSHCLHSLPFIYFFLRNAYICLFCHLFRIVDTVYLLIVHKLFTIPHIHIFQLQIRFNSVVVVHWSISHVKLHFRNKFGYCSISRPPMGTSRGWQQGALLHQVSVPSYEFNMWYCCIFHDE